MNVLIKEITIFCFKSSKIDLDHDHLDLKIRNDYPLFSENNCIKALHEILEDQQFDPNF